MAYLDYSLPQVVDVSKDIAAVGDALTDAMKRREQRREFDATQKLQREQETRKLNHQIEYDNYLKGIEARKERMGELTFSAQQEERNAARMERARHAANPQDAAAIAAGTVTYDPHTAKEIGRGRLTPGAIPDVGPAPTAPVEPALPTPAEAI